MFQPFLNWPSSGWSTVQEELYNYYNIIIRGERGDEISFKKAGRVCRLVVENWTHVLTMSAWFVHWIGSRGWVLRKKLKTHILRSITFPENRAVYEVI
jgi:hypothetical protein